MAETAEREVRIAIGDDQQVSGLLIAPKNASSCYVVAHGAGVGMRHSFMHAIAAGLGEHGIATLRYQFPYMEQGRKSPGSPQVAQTTVRAAVSEASDLVPGMPLIAGGKSYGARMTSQAQAETPLENVRGLAFLGFPLHAPNQPSNDRAEHLEQVSVPMLFLQGSRDDFAHHDYLKPLVARLGSRATLKLFEDADHSFHVPAKTGRSDTDVMAKLLDALAAWANSVTC